MKRPLIVTVGLLAWIACNPEHSLTEVLNNKSCSDAGSRCVHPYVCNEQTYKCVMPDELPATGGFAGNSSDDPSPAGAGGAPQQVSSNTDPVVDGQGGVAGSEAAAAGTGGVGSTDPVMSPADAGCATMVELFRDLDGDGYGSAASGHLDLGCPEEGWVERGDDCFDAVPTQQNRAAEVHPDQTAFFATGYPLPGEQSGEVSFDYDCSLQEEPDTVNNPKLGAFVTCSGGNPGSGCSDKYGIVPEDRSGPGVNNLCGSTSLQACMPQVGDECVLGALSQNRDPFLCH